VLSPSTKVALKPGAVSKGLQNPLRQAGAYGTHQMRDPPSIGAFHVHPGRQVVAVVVAVLEAAGVRDEALPRGLSRPVYQPAGGAPVSRVIVSTARLRGMRSVASSTCW